MDDRARWVGDVHFVCFCWLFFRAPSLDAATTYLAGIFTDNGQPNSMPAVVWPLLAVGALTQLLPSDFRARLGGALDLVGWPAQVAFGAAAMYAVLVMAPSASAPFIYFQF